MPCECPEHGYSYASYGGGCPACTELALKKEIHQLRIKVEAYDEQHEVARLAIEAGRILLEQRGRLTALLRGAGANRYWEGRWRDERRENETLRAALDWISSRCPKEFMGQLVHPHRDGRQEPLNQLGRQT